MKVNLIVAIFRVNWPSREFISFTRKECLKMLLILGYFMVLFTPLSIFFSSLTSIFRLISAVLNNF